MVKATASPFVRNLVRRRTESLQLARIVIIRGSLGTLDRTTGQVGGVGNVQTIYCGNARVRPVTDRVISVGGGELVQRDTIVTIPIDAQVPQRDDIVYIGCDSAADASLAQFVLVVTGVDAGGYFGDGRRVSCAGYGKSRSYNP